ncbi:MAG: phosphotransferase [Desulfobulbaceae bacterium]|uniref:Phosphotransferase n=1 Tax=Candidatus Desulfobia pelagia TaxID=2841692 RepID=A0A8J6NC82_9BACT|nr:phosphotransferase [Candidatus Desulfobia pelagia]
MVFEIDNKYRVIIQNLLKKGGFGSFTSLGQVEALAGDGSDRLFFRLHLSDCPPLVAIIASPFFDKGLIETKSTFQIGTHLFDKGVPVPEIFAFEARDGAVLCADLGDTHLQKICSIGGFKEAERYYKQAIDALVKLQFEGANNFDLRFCWDTPRYNEKLMLERESGYFYRSFCRDFMGRIPDDSRVTLEFQKIAQRAGCQSTEYLLHRDFQSRNLMVHKEKVYIIDFQGARMGPLAYDLASLLIDPYAGLSESQQETLYRYYIDSITQKVVLDPDLFYEGFLHLSLQRNLQILGAFAFLSQVKGKDFFKQYIFPAAHSLAALLGKIPGNTYPFLAGLIKEIIEQMEEENIYRTVII